MSKGSQPGQLVPLRRVVGQPSEMSDEALLAACAVGDGAALGALYDRLQPALWRFLARLAGTRVDELDDLCQATFLAVHGSARRFRGGSSVRTWVFGIAANLVKHHVRSQVRRRAALAALASSPTAVRESPEESARRTEIRARLPLAIEALPHDLRVAFVMCDLEQMSGRQAAQALGIPEGTLGRRVHEARRALRVLLAAERAGEE